MQTPDLTKAQLVAIGSAVIDTLLAFGVHLSSVQQHVLLADLGLAAAFLASDAVIRHGRATGANRAAKSGPPADTFPSA